jgi:hypothetical protein
MFGPDYELRDGEVIRVVMPPFPGERMEYCRKTHPDGEARIVEEAKAIWITRNAGKPKVVARFFGKISAALIIQSLLDVYPQEIECAEEIGQWPVNADFVIDRDAGPDRYHRAVEESIGRIVGAEILLVRREVEWPVMVFTGLWNENAGGNAARRIDIHGGELSEPIIESRRGDVELFSRRLGAWIGKSVMFETTGTPGEVEWHIHHIRRGTREQLERSKDPELVLGHVEEQTGLVCSKQVRVQRRLFVERKV